MQIFNATDSNLKQTKVMIESFLTKQTWSMCHYLFWDFFAILCSCNSFSCKPWKKVSRKNVFYPSLLHFTVQKLTYMSSEFVLPPNDFLFVFTIHRNPIISIVSYHGIMDIHMFQFFSFRKHKKGDFSNCLLFWEHYNLTPVVQLTSWTNQQES